MAPLDDVNKMIDGLFLFDARVSVLDGDPCLPFFFLRLDLLFSPGGFFSDHLLDPVFSWTWKSLWSFLF